MIDGCVRELYAKKLCRYHYDRTPERLAYASGYAKSDKARARQKVYRSTSARKEYMRKYHQDPENKARKNAKRKALNGAPELREKSRAYHRSEKAKARALIRRRTPEGLFNHAKHKAKSRSLIWTITFNEYVKLRTRGCDYCGDLLPAGGVGLDRVDNTQGYTLTNVVPCCEVCNTARSDFFTVQEMRYLGVYIARIKKSRTKNTALENTP